MWRFYVHKFTLDSNTGSGWALTRLQNRSTDPALIDASSVSVCFCQGVNVILLQYNFPKLTNHGAGQDS